jgi:predicted nucleotidyltransferase
MVNRETAIEKSKQFLNELTRSGVSIDTAYLYGSFAKGNQHEWSDIDLAIFSEQFTGFGFTDKELIAPLNVRREYVDIEVKTFPIKELKDPNPFVEQIFKLGIELKW